MVKKMHSQENTLFDLDLGVKVTQIVVQCHIHHVTYPPTEFEVTTFKRFRRRCIYKKIHFLTFDLGVKVTQNLAQYPLRHVIYSAKKLSINRTIVLPCDLPQASSRAADPRQNCIKV